MGFHVTMRLADESGIARTPPALRLASQLVLRNGRHRGMIFHRFADTHLHAVLRSNRAEAGMFARCTEGALRKVLGLRAPFERCRIRPIESERHFAAALRYGIRQEEHHGTAFDEAHDGSGLPDLVGLRLGSEWLWARLRETLPRVSRKMLLDWAGLPEFEVGELDLRYLSQAAAAAFGVGGLHGRTAAQARARRVAVHVLTRLAPRSGPELVLGISARSAVRYRRDEVTELELRVVERQLRMRGNLARRHMERRLGTTDLQASSTGRATLPVS